MRGNCRTKEEGQFGILFATIRIIRGQMFFGKRANCGSRAGQAVLAGGGEILRQTEGTQRVGLARGDFEGRGAAEEIAEQCDQPADERRIGIAAKLAAARGIDGADEIDYRNAAAHAVFVSAFGRRKRRKFFRAVHDGAEPLLRIIDDGEIVGELLLLGGEGHGTKRRKKRRKAQKDFLRKEINLHRQTAATPMAIGRPKARVMM